MPAQTTKGNIYFPDGAKVQVKAQGDVSYSDMGALTSAINLSLDYEENQVVLSNAAKTAKQITAMSVAGSFTLASLDPVTIAKMGGGMFEVVTTAASPVATVPDQTIAANWDDNTIYDLDLQTSSSDSTPLKATAIPTFTSITLDPTGTPEVLVANTEYVIITNPNSPSGYSIQFISSGMATVTPKTYEIVIDYASVTPVARTTTYAGTSTQVLTPVDILFTHTDSNGLLREVHLPSINSNSGGFQFNFKGANEDGIEEMPIAFTGDLDTDLTDGRQLISWVVDAGAA